MNGVGDSPQTRRSILAQAGFNLDLVPACRVADDYQTDSLMNVTVSAQPLPDGDDGLDTRLSQSFNALFGMPLVIAVAQGRMAEAILSNALVVPGDRVPGSLPFPTMQAHLQRNGAVSVPVAAANAQPDSALFCGDIDVVALERVITQVGQRVPYLLLEACTNAIGGHPLSVENLRAIREVADRHEIPVFLDATRIFSNASLIRQRAPGWQEQSVEAIVLELCALADGLLLSATKEFPCSIGGFLATRNRDVFQRCLDQTLLFGAGLDVSAKRRLVVAMSDAQGLVDGVAERLQRVRKFQALLGTDCQATQPSAAHGVFLNGGGALEAIPGHLHPARAFLNHLYVKYGIRGALNPGASVESGEALIRFAVPIVGKSDNDVETAARCIRAALAEADEFVALEEVSRPVGVSGALMATYRPVESIGS
ncbi:beta-eliminating lyase-related protein [Pseudomonas sp. 681]|uniref:Beta-eliminating lyase-related protein n=1 Tax=Pseudomonas fungipugnans TaxID=3024217 RepID=A0ABT6QH53_9PSED|nr:beta-eliminating lyase-related protein [Pseudomonas sp. 681]MDI2590214.1 beta-eliminating lyase-related protein [Pseudomonas sp. 681]